MHAIHDELGFVFFQSADNSFEHCGDVGEIGNCSIKIRQTKENEHNTH